MERSEREMRTFTSLSVVGKKPCGTFAVQQWIDSKIAEMPKGHEVTEVFLDVTVNPATHTISLYLVLTSESDNEELDLNGIQIEGGSFLSSLFPLTTAVLSIVGTPTSTEIVVDVLSKLDNVPVSGLDVADFILNDAQTISGAVESTTQAGRYTLSGTGLVTGTLELVPPASLSISQPFESEAPVAVTIA